MEELTSLQKPSRLVFFLCANLAATASIVALCRCIITIAMSMHDTIMGMTKAAVGTTIDFVRAGMCRGMLAGGPQVDSATTHGLGAAAGSSRLDPSMVDGGRRGHVGGAQGGGIPMPDDAWWRNVDNGEGPSRPEPD